MHGATLQTPAAPAGSTPAAALACDAQARPELAWTLTCTARNDGTQLGGCASPSWWLTSVQIVFEIGGLPADGRASQDGARTTLFSVGRMSERANDPNGVTGRARADNTTQYAPALAGIIRPTTNPETTDANGSFRRDVLPGCANDELLIKPTRRNGAPEAPSGGGGSDGLPVDLVVRPPGITRWGDIAVTDSAPARSGPDANLINQAWNVVYARVGSQATDVHPSASDPWNTLLQPGASTFSAELSAVP